MIEVSMRQMLEAGVHFGHQTRFWDPKMAPYIFGIRHKIHIINLEQTLPLFRDALKFIHDVASNRGKVLFVGTKYAARDIVKEEATRAGMPYVNYRWLGGMLTNYKTIRQSIKRLKEFEELLAHEDNLKNMTKKEVLNLVREKDKLSASLSGIKNMGGLPDALFIIDVGHEKIAVQEAKRLGIPIIGIVDTNVNPENIDYIVPGNDDAIRAIRFYCNAIADTIIEVRGASAEAEMAEGAAANLDAEITKKIHTKKSKVASKEADAELSANTPVKNTKRKKPVASKADTKELSTEANADSEEDKPDNTTV